MRSEKGLITPSRAPSNGVQRARGMAAGTGRAKDTRVKEGRVKKEDDHGEGNEAMMDDEGGHGREVGVGGSRAYDGQQLRRPSLGSCTQRGWVGRSPSDGGATCEDLARLQQILIEPRAPAYY